MATNKSFSDLEQSKKLAEILPLESADMYYCYGMDIHTKECSLDETPTIIDTNNQIDICDIPCWSLAALLNVIPKRIKHYNVLTIDISENEFAIRYDEIAYRCNNDLPDITKDNPVDACYEMIVKLHELNLL